MSTTIDQKVVEMRFDNKQFENGVQTTMSTLDKFKQALKLDGAVKGLESVNEAAKNNNISALGSAAEAVKVKFSALEVMAITALTNITNQAVNAGKRLVAAFTIDPVKTGFQEYELKMGSVQTIMASTGESLEKINEYLEELNTYSDKTIYSFSDMTNNIGKFTNAGVKLEDAVAAIKGISNEAAVSGANANEASRAMYNFSQALSAGYVKLIDWKSIENANMATVEFKNHLLDAAVAAGTVEKSSDGMYKVLTTNASGSTMDDAISSTRNFNDSLAYQWMTTEVLTNTLAQYATDVREMTDAEREAYEEKLRGQGYTEEQIKSIEELGKKAFDSAQDVKTFTMMMDTLKEAAQSGWAKTWELILGDFNKAKTLWTNLSKFFGNLIDKMSDARNMILESALGKGFSFSENFLKGLIYKVESVTEPIKKSADSVKAVVDSVKDYGKVVDEILGNKWGNGQDRWNRLTEAGYDWAHAQNLVNERLGCSVRHVTNYKEAQKGAVETQEKAIETSGKITESIADHIVTLTKLSDAQLKEKGFTDKQIEAFRELEDVANKTGIPLKELLLNIDEFNGRYLLLNGFKNIGQSLVTIFESLGKAWRDVFPPMQADQLFNIIAGFHKLTTYLVINDENADKLRRTFKGLFAALDVILTITAGPLKIAFKILTQLLGAFDMNVLDLTAMIGDSIVGFRDWMDSVLDFSAAFEAIAPYIESAANAIREWIDANVDFTAWFEKIKTAITEAAEAIGKWIEGLKETDDVPKYIMDTLSKGLDAVKEVVGTKLKEIGQRMFDGILEFALLDWASVPTDIIAGFNKGFVWGLLSVIKNIRLFCTKIITTVKDLFGIHSPSRVMYEIGENVVQGFIDGVGSMITGAVNAVKNFFSRVKEAGAEDESGGIFDGVIEGVKNFGAKLSNAFSKIDFGKIIAAALGVGMIVVAKKAIDVLEMFGKPLEGIGDLLSGLGEAFSGFGKNLKASAMLKKSKALLLMGVAIGVLVYAVLPLTKLNWEQLGKAAASLAVLSALMVGMIFALDKLGSKDISVNANLLLMAGSILIIAGAMKLLSKVAVEGKTEDTLKMLAAMLIGLASIMIAFGIFVKTDKSANMDKAGIMIFKMAAALLTIASVVKIVSGFTFAEIKKGLQFVLGVGVLFAAITTVSKFAGEHADKAGSMLLKMSVAMLIMAFVVKTAAGFTNEEIKRGLGFIAGVEALFVYMVAVSYFAGANANKAGSMILRMSIAMLAMVAVVKIASGMSEDEIKRGLTVVLALEALFVAMIGVSKFAGGNVAKAGAMLLAMSVAIGVLVALCYIVGKLDAKEMWKGFVFIAALEALFAGLIVVTKFAGAADDIKTTLILLLVAVGLMVAAVAGLSFIDPKSLGTATAALSAVMGMFAAMMVATKFTKNTKDMRKSILELLMVAAALTGLIVILSKQNPESALKASESLSLLLITFSSAIFILGKTDRISKTAIDAITDMLVVAGALGILLATMSFLPQANIPSLIASSIALGILLNAFASSMVILSKADKMAPGVEVAAMKMGIVVAELALVLGLMSALNVEASIKSAIALGILLNMLAASMVILNFVGPHAIAAVPSAMLMGIVVAELAVVLGLMSALNVEASISSAIALGILLNMLAASLVILNFVGPQAIAAVPAAMLMGIVVAELALVLGLMTMLKVESAIPSAIALSILLTALSASLVIISLVGPIAMAAIPAAVLMGLVIMELAVAMGIMASMNVESAIPYAISLSILLIAMTVAIGLLGAISAIIPAAMVAVVGMGVVIAELVALLAVIGGIAQIPGVQWLITEGGNFLYLIGTAIGQFVGGIVGGIAEGVASVLPAIGTYLSEFMTNVQVFLDGARNINADVLVGIGILTSAIILLTAAEMITGILSFGGLGLIAFGLMLSGFIVAARPFLDTITTLDPASVEAAKSLAEMILVLTAAELISGVTRFLGGSTDFSTFGTQLENFGNAIVGFSNLLRENGGIDAAGIQSAANAGKLLAELQKSLEGTGGIKQALFGEKDLGTFGTQLENFGIAIVGFSNLLRENGGIDEKAVESAANAGKLLADLQSSLEATGGIKQALFGEKDLSLFGTQLVSFGKAICEFSNTLRDNGGIDQTSVESAANAGKVMAALQNEIVSAGGIKQKLFGEKSLDTFGSQIKAFGTAIVEFSDIVAGNISEDAITSASNAGKVMAEVQKAIPEDKWLDGKISIDDFGAKIVSFGTSLVDYSNQVVNIDQESMSRSLTAAQKLVAITKSVVDLDTSGIYTFSDVSSIGYTIKAYSDAIADSDLTSISSSITSASKLISLAKSAVGLDMTGIDSFKSVKTIGYVMKDYAVKASEVSPETVNASIVNARKLVSLINSMSGIDTSGVAAFKSAISSLSNIETSGIANAFKDTEKFSALGANVVNAIKSGIDLNQELLTTSGTALTNNISNGFTLGSTSVLTTINGLMNKLLTTIASKRSLFNTSGASLISNLASGMMSKKSEARSAGIEAASSAVSGVVSYYQNFYNAGSYLVDGFASGISENSYKAAAKAKAMAEAAYNAAKQALDINSPSKVFRSLGYNVPEGFAMGIDRMSNMVKDSSVSMADTAINSVKDSISDIARAINTDIDSQPVIRPVVDLSEAESGAKAISGLFNNNQSVGVLANVNGINSMMNAKNQNGANDELVSAIDKLRRDLSSVGNTYYTIDGITYSEGSEVSDAINLLTRAIRVEGRV